MKSFENFEKESLAMKFAVCGREERREEEIVLWEDEQECIGHPSV